MLRRQGFAAAAFRHQQAVCVREIRIEHRKGNELPERSLEENERASPGAHPRHFYGDQIGDIRGQHVLVPLIRFAQTGQGPKEDAALGDCLRYGLRAVHVREGVQDFLGAVGQLALRLFEIPHRHCRMRRPHDHRKAQLRRLERRRDDVALDLHQLRLRNLCLGIRFEVAVRILLGCGHLLQPLLVALEHLHLVRDHHLAADHDRKPKSRKVLKHTGKGRIGQFLQAHNVIEVAVDVQIRFRLVQDARVRRLIARAAVLNHLLGRHVGPVIAACRMLGMLQCLEQFLGREPPRAKVGRLHRSLDAAQDRLELRAISLMFLARALDGLGLT